LTFLLPQFERLSLTAIGRLLMDFKLGEDYYVEDGLVIMTAAFHLKRGTCCGSGCRHCPYVPRHQAGTAKVADEYKTVAAKAMPDGER